MDTNLISTLSSGLDYGSARLEAISNNLSNVNTPGYQRKDVSFNDLLNSVSGDSDQLTMEQSDTRDLSNTGIGASAPAITTQGGGAMNSDGNNVDIDTESARLAAAQIYYEGTAQMLTEQFSNLKYVISGGS